MWQGKGKSHEDSDNVSFESAERQIQITDNVTNKFHNIKIFREGSLQIFFFFFFERISAGCCLSLSFSLLSTFHSFPLAENLGGDFHPEGK